MKSFCLLLSVQLKHLRTNAVRKRSTQTMRSGAGKAALAILFGLAFLSVFMCFYMWFNMTASVLLETGPAQGVSGDEVYFLYVSCVALAFGIIGSIFTAYTALYDSKDNDLLLAMPIRPSALLGSRAVALYLLTFAGEALVLLPAEIAYLVVKDGAVGLQPAAYLLYALALVLLSLAVSCVLAGLIALLISRFAKKNTVITALSVLWMAVYFLIMRGVQSIANGEGLPFEPPVSLSKLLGSACVGRPLPLLAVLLLAVAAFAVIFACLARSFLRLGTANRGTRKRHARQKAYKLRSVFRAILGKEGLRFRSSAVYFLNCGLGALVLLLMPVGVLFKRQEILSLLQHASSLQAAFPLLIGIGVCFLSGMCMITAPSVSLEGKTIWVLRSLPVEPADVFCGKCALQVLVSGIPALLCLCVCGIVLQLSFAMMFAVSLLCMLLILLQAQEGLMLNLKFPNLTWDNESVPVKMSLPVFLSMLADWVQMGLLIALYFLLPDRLPALCFLLIACLLTALANALCMLWLKRRGRVLWNSLS